ncbi:MAG TPA: ADP-ribosyltransferase [Solirubrobacteraceae bacterium]
MAATPSPRRFTDRLDASAWYDATFRPWEMSLSEAERHAIYEYKAYGFADLNEALRFDGSPDQNLVTLLDRAIARHQLREPVIVFRGLVSEILRYEIADLTGDEITDLAYVSTSLLQIVAEDFIAAESRDERLIAEILIPGGVHVGALVGAPDQVRNLGELEILIPRGSRFEIVGTEPERDPPIIEMEVLI